MWPHGSWQPVSHSPAATYLTGEEQHFNSSSNNSSASSYAPGAPGAPQSSFSPLLTDAGFSSNISSPARSDAMTVSGTPQPPKPLGLDARAAELKEKLLKSRSQSQTQARAAPPRPPADAASKPAETTPSNSMASLPADANDIAALISSISSASESAGSGSTVASRDGQQQSSSTRQAMSTSERISPPPSSKISVSTTAAAATGEKPSIKDVKQAVTVRTPIGVTLNPRNPVNGSVAEAGKPKELAKNDKSAEPAAFTVRTESRRAEYQDRKGPVARRVSETSLKTAKVLDTASRQELGNEKPRQTSTKPPAHGSTRDSEVKSSTVVPKMVPAVGLPRSVDKAATTQNTGHPEQLSPDDAFTRLLSQVPDLKDFLEMTDYYNVETRTRKLDRFRRAQALAAERLRIEEEERKLREEEELEISLPRSTAPRLTSAVPSAAPSAPAGPGSNSLPTPTAPMPPSMDENKATADVKPAKRAHDEEVIETRQEKVPRLEAPARPKDDKEHDQRDVRDSRRGSSPYRRPSSPHHSFRRSPPLRLRMQADYDDRDSRPFRKYDSYKGHDDYYASSERRVPYPVQIDLGRKGDTRFFIVKSFNEENVLRCMEDGLWTTQVQNGEILTEAFTKCKNVILFFSINKSRAFQGFARMSTAPSPDIPRPSFVKGIHWDTSDPFRVQWLSRTAVDFWRIGHLKNALNEHQPVLVGKDGQEIEEECGAELMRAMGDIAADQDGRGRETAGGYGGGGGGGGGGRHEGGYRGRRGIDRGGGYRGYRDRGFFKRESSVERR